MAEHEDDSMSKLEVIQAIYAGEIVKMLDDLYDKLKQDSFSQDYLGGIRHAQHAIINMNI